jgi:hypothetical protein
MKKYLIGLLSIALLLASIFGVTTPKGARDRRPGRSGGSSDRVLWV